MNTRYELMVAPTGARLSKADHPAVPISTVEIANTAAECAAAGASAIHVHVRDNKQAHSLDPAKYQETTNAIAKRTSVRVQISTEAAETFGVGEQSHCLLNANARDASVSIREMMSAPETLSQTYTKAAAKGTDIQHILYDVDDLSALLQYFDTVDIPPQSRRAIFVLGRYSKNKTSNPADLKPFLDGLGSNHLNWSVCAFGRNEQACLLSALNEGGNVRIGFENNIVSPTGHPFPSNAVSVASFVEAADKAGFQPIEITQ